MVQIKASVEKTAGFVPKTDRIAHLKELSGLSLRRNRHKPPNYRLEPAHRAKGKRSRTLCADPVNCPADVSSQQRTLEGAPNTTSTPRSQDLEPWAAAASRAHAHDIPAFAFGITRES